MQARRAGCGFILAVVMLVVSVNCTGLQGAMHKVFPFETMTPTAAHRAQVTRPPTKTVETDIPVTPSPTPANIVTVYTGYQNGRLNVRGGPGVTYPVLFELLEGSTVTYTIQPGEETWVEIISCEGTGYVNRNYLMEAQNGD